VKTVGLIGGMSWESTALYYRLMNEAVRERLGGLHSARIVLHSVEFAEVEALQRAEAWEEAGTLLAGAARSLERAGAEALVLCTNTMHKVAPAIEAATTVPFIHIADPTAAAAKAAGLERVGLLGTRFTMEQPFYRDRLERVHGIEVVVPGASDRETVHRTIYEELCLGMVDEASREAFRAVIGRLVASGAQAVILGCTEIGMLVGPQDSPVPVLDTTALHACAAAAWAMTA